MSRQIHIGELFGSKKGDVRIINALEANRIETLAELRAESIWDIGRLHGIGRTSMKRIREVLAAYDERSVIDQDQAGQNGGVSETLDEIRELCRQIKAILDRSANNGEVRS